MPWAELVLKNCLSREAAGSVDEGLEEQTYSLWKHDDIARRAVRIHNFCLV